MQGEAYKVSFISKSQSAAQRARQHFVVAVEEVDPFRIDDVQGGLSCPGSATLLIFHGFLRQSYFGGSFWNFVQAVVLGFALYYAGTWVLQFALTKLAPGFTIYNNETVGSLISDNEYIMMAVTIILAPVIEETLVRGLVFGSIRPTSRVMAYIVSVVLFTLMHNWQYFLLYPAGKVLLSCIPYLPASVALAWTYEKAGTIWAPITLHALINALSFGLLQLNF